MSSCCFVEFLNNIVALKRSRLLTLQVNVNFVIKHRHNALKNQRGGMFKTSALFFCKLFLTRQKKVTYARSLQYWQFATF